MVLCYKLMTELPSGRRSASASPRRRGAWSSRKQSPCGRQGVHDVQSSMSQLVSMLDYEPFGDGMLHAVPEKEWRLLSVILRKRDEDEERAAVADQCHRMWEDERKTREMDGAIASESYKRFLHNKRQRERTCHELKQLERELGTSIHRRQLMDYIIHKENRTKEFLAFEQSKKATQMVDRVVEDEARGLLARDRRSQYHAAQEWKKQVEMIDKMQRVDDARQRRREMLRHNAQRVAIVNTLSVWEAKILKQEVDALDRARRAHHAWHAAVTHARGQRLLRDREERDRRARAMAQLCQQLRDVAKYGKRDRSV